jgi:glycosyltransferase involved in cell wall biosynthesis
VAGQNLGRGPVGPVDVIVDVQNGMPFLSPLFTRTPVVNLVHQVHREQWPVVLPPLKARIGWLLESRVAPRVYRGHPYVTVSDATRRELEDLGVAADRVRVVHNGTDVQAVPARPRAARPTVLAVSRLVPHKRLDVAVRAIALLRDRIPGLRLVIAGTGYWEPELRALVAELGLADTVELLGWIDEDRKHRLMAQAWVMATPSLKEGWGLSVIEAAAHGTPSVAFHGAGGLSDSIIDGQTGLLVRGGVGEFSAGLANLLEDAALRDRMRAAAQAHATGFTWSATAKGISMLLEEVLAGEGSGGIALHRTPGHPAGIASG